MEIIKLGGSIITRKFGYMEPDDRNIESLAKILAKYWHGGKRDIIIVHGAGSFGHAPVLAHGIAKAVKSEKNKLGFADVHASCSYLSLLIVEALIKNEVPAVSIPPTAIMEQSNGRISKFDSKIVMDFLKQGYLPVLYGDMILDKKTGGSVCSGDQIVSYLGKTAKRIIFAGNVDGVMVNGKVVEKINNLNMKHVEKYLMISDAPDITGGMAGKVREIIRMKRPAFIVNAVKHKRLEDILYGRKATSTEICMK